MFEWKASSTSVGVMYPARIPASGDGRAMDGRRRVFSARETF